MGFFRNLATPAPIPVSTHSSQWDDIVNAYVAAYSDGKIDEPLSVAAIYRARQMNASTVAALPLTLNGQPVPAPNAHQSWLQFVTECILAMEDHGEAYVYVSATQSLSVLPNRDVQAKWNNDETIRLYERPNGSLFNDDPASMFRNLIVIPLNRGADDLTGVGPMESGRVQSVLAAQKFMAEYYENNAQPTGVLQVPSVMTSDEAAKLKSAWMESRVPRSPAVLSGGIQWTSEAFSPQESQWVEGHTAGVLDIATLFGVPSHFLSASPAGSSLTYTNVQDLNLYYWLQTLWPLYAYPILSALAGVMEVPVSAFQFDTETLFLPGLAERSQAASVLVAAGYDPASVLSAVSLPQMGVTEVASDSPV